MKSSSSVKSSSSKKTEKSSSSKKVDKSSSSSSEPSIISKFLNPAISYGEFKDPRDKQIYKTVVIGDQIWFAQNLNLKYLDGGGSFCLNDEPANCDTTGRLYTWGAAMDSTGTYTDKGINCGAGKECNIIAPAQGICPDNWRLPSKNDWERLISYIGGRDNASTKLKSEAWVGFGGIKGTNDYGFSAIPSGYRDSDGTYDSEGLNFWSSTEESNIYVYAMRFRDGDDWGDVTERSREAAKPVRCVKDLVDEPIEGTLKDTRDGKTYKTIKIGNYTWMAENLKVDARNDPNCGFEQKCSSTEKAKDICPDGWRLPTSGEFRTLLEDVGGNGFAGHRLKSTSGWDPYKNAGNSIDAVGFTALAAGATSMHGVSGDEGRFTYFWSDSESDSWNGVYLFASYYGIDASTGYEYKNNYFSVRCIKVKKIP